ncbi:MAG: hypothetical protein ACREOI_18415 [bacterium]
MKSKPSKTNHKVFIADRGNVQFWYPHDWKFTPKNSGIIKLEDPGEDCILEISYLPLPQVDIPLPSPKQQLWMVMQKDAIAAKEEDIQVSERNGQFTACVEYSYEDHIEHREARRFMAIVSNRLFQSLITFCFWPEHAARLKPALQMVLDSFVLGTGFQYASPQQALQILTAKN